MTMTRKQAMTIPATAPPLRHVAEKQEQESFNVTAAQADLG